MRVFSFGAAGAFVILALSLAQPASLRAQSDAPATESTAAEGWQAVTRFGFTFELPPGALVTDDVESPDLNAYAVSSMGNGATGTRLGLRLLSPIEMIDAPAPGSEGFAGFLTDMGQVPVTPTGAVLDPGDRRLLVYAGEDRIPASGGARLEARMLYLFSETPDASGNHLMIAVFSAGLAAEEAAGIEARFVASLRAEAPAQDAPLPEEGLAEEALAEPALPEEALPVEALPEEALPEEVLTGEAPAEATLPEDTPAEPDATPDPAAPAEVAAPVAEAAEAPESVAEDRPDWEPHERFGLVFSTPPGMEARRDSESPITLEYWLQSLDPAGQVQHEVSLRVFTPADLAEMAAPPLTDPAFADLLSDFAGMPVSPAGETHDLGEIRFHLFRGESAAEAGEPPLTDRILYLIPEAPAANGLSPWFALYSAGQSQDAVAAFETGFLASLSGAPVPPESQPLPPVAVIPQGPGKVPLAEIPAPEPMPEPMPDSIPEPANPSTASSEAQAWQQAQAEETEAAMLAYLAAYPRGLHSGEARRWLHARAVVPPDETPQQAGPAADPDAEAWALALEQGTATAFWTYLKAQPQGAFVAEARHRLSAAAPEKRARE